MSALGRSGSFPELALRLTGVGEQTGQLEPMLERTGSIYEQALQQQLGRLANLLTPVLTIAIGVAGGWPHLVGDGRRCQHERTGAAMNETIERRDGSHDLGFTLMELLVVVGLLALAAALAPSLNRARLGLMVKSAAYELAATLRTARAAARVGNAEQVLTMDLVRRQYWAAGVVGPRQLPRGVAVSLTVPESERLGANSGGVRFFPDGSASGAKFLLNDGITTASVSVDWLSGDVRIHMGP